MRVLKILLIDVEKTLINISLMNVENTMDRTCEQWGSFKEDRNYKKLLNFLGYITRKEHLYTKDILKGKESKWKQVTYLTSLSEWMVEQWQRKMVKEQELLRATKDWKLWKAMIAHILKGYGIIKEECLKGY